MKKQPILIAICLLLFTACAAVPEPKKSSTDEESYAKAMSSFNHKNYNEYEKRFRQI